MFFPSISIDESPMLGLFFLEGSLDPEVRVNLSTDRPLATGMAWLASSDGVVVTCSHVVLVLGAAPGMHLSLFGATESVDIEVKAEVLEMGWRGPTLDEQGAQPLHPFFWDALWDDRPDVFREDIAFLRILPETARWHDRDELGPGSPARSMETAAHRLLRNARVLPLNRAGYVRPGALLKAWSVAWVNGAPDCQQTEAEFRSFDRQGHHALRICGARIRKGFSGGPLWDSHRGVVVGMVRRGLPAMGDLVLATDGLAIGQAHSAVKLTADSRLSALRDRIAATLDNAQPQRYAFLEGARGDYLYVDPEVAEVHGSNDPLDSRHKQIPLPAIEHLSEALFSLRRVVVRGAAGIGKSMLLRRLGAELLSRAQQNVGLNVVPLLLGAAEFVARNLKLGDCLEEIWSVVRPVEMTDSAIDVLAENGASLVLMIDGIDEIEERDLARLLARLDIRRGGLGRSIRATDEPVVVDRLVAAVVVTTRPSERWIASGSRDGFGTQGGLYDLLRFDTDRIDQFCTKAFPIRERRELFRNALRKVRWGRDKATPLQLNMAASVFVWKGALPDRSIDLTAQFVHLAIESARTDYVQRHQGPIRDEVRDRYLPHLSEVLGFVAAASNATGDSLSEQGFVKAFNSLPSDRSRPWATNLGSLFEFFYKDIPPYLPILIPHLDDRRIEWAHRTFAELLGAEYLVTTQRSSSEAWEGLYNILEHGHGPGLALLGVLDRAGDDTTVETILRKCMDHNLGRLRPQLFALRALGAGLDAKGRTRRAQVKLLVRHLVSDFRERGLCIHFFIQEDLPEARDLLAYDELRDDFYQVMLDRLRSRIARATPMRPAVVMARESMILRLTGLWPDFLDLGLSPPSSDGEAADTFTFVPSRKPGTVSEQVGVARILVRDGNGFDRIVEMPALNFVASLAAVARNTSDDTPATRLIDLAVVIELGSPLANRFDPPDGVH